MARSCPPLLKASSTRFVALGLFLTLGLVWLLVGSGLRDPRDLVASAKDHLLNGQYETPEVLDEAAVAATTAITATLNGTAEGDRPLVLYAYAESVSGRADLAFFLHNGLHRRADFVFIINGPSNVTDMIPADLPNVRVVQRPNKCFDLGAFGEVLRAGDLWKRYKRFITMNASIRGPFLPAYSSACWTDIFLDRVTARNKLVGLSLNCSPRPHVQSMIWATDDVGMSLLLDPKLAHSVPHEDGFGSKNDPAGLTPCYKDWMQAVHAEIATTELIQKQGYDVDALMTSFHGYSGGNPRKTATSKYCRAMENAGDPFTVDGYFGSNIHPYETVFVKANRKLDLPLLEHMTSWHMNINRRAWDLCGP